MENIVTYKIEYKSKEKEIIQDYIKKYNNLLRCTYNHAFELEDFSQKDLYQFQTTLKNVTLECGFRNGCIYKVKELLKHQKTAKDKLNKKRKQHKLFERTRIRKILFGGKNLWNRYIKGLISKEEFETKRNFPIISVGEALQKGNRHFRIQNNQIIFQPNKNCKIELNIKPSRNYSKDLKILQKLQEEKAIPITYQLDLDYVYLTFDLNKVREIQSYKPISNRYLSIDLNPNYIGYVISEWKDELEYKIIEHGVISNEKLNEIDNLLKGKGLDSTSKERKYITNKRNYEVCQIAILLTNLATHYKVEAFGFEDLSIESKDLNKGRKTNRLCNNQWNRNKLVEQIKKRCLLNNIRFLELRADYSSFIGNLGYRQERIPDMCLSALELGRRTYEFMNQYVKKTKEIKKNIILPEVGLFQKRIEQALEEIDYIVKFDGLLKLYTLIKKSKTKYRLLLTELSGEVSSLLSTKSYLKLYKFENFCT